MGLRDMDILIAVATGLGKREEDGDGGEYYVKDPECLGEHSTGLHSWDAQTKGLCRRKLGPEAPTETLIILRKPLTLD
jgi:hypothetical protein